MDSINNLHPAPQEEDINQALQATLDRLSPFIGEWFGYGNCSYPTIDSCDYEEALSVRLDPGKRFLTYEQKTILVDAQGHPIRHSHWEGGVIRPLVDGSLELACVEGSGRVEILRGQLVSGQSHPDELRFRFKSVLVANDEIAKSSSREWTVAGDRFTYVMSMTTTSVEALTIHLQAGLQRKN